ncbi:hypothetical protein AHAS_Ahas20G0243900 [Arachis hypogaea]
MVESQQLYEIWKKQSTIRGEFLSGIEEAMQHGDTEAYSIGTRVILPSSFTGGRRYMFNNRQEAMAICKHFGYPNLFMIMTCNPNRPEFQRYTSVDGIPIAGRLDISCRVFHVKMKCLLEDLKSGVFFGPLNTESSWYKLESIGSILENLESLNLVCGIPSRIQGLDDCDELQTHKG